ncbi:MAG: FAD-dependent thymidylate synthase [Clostridia bacterium]|nr:FAD-dependent thymidylate synthase [Clostridia bacterium]
MIIVPPSFEFIQEFDGVEMLKRIERIGRVCYKSEEKITEDSYKKFIAGIVKRGHESVIEHEKISVKITCDRGVTHEIVRHRLASYSQESTRYCNYAKEQFGKEITVIKPCFWKEDSKEYAVWKASMEESEQRYFQLIELGATPQEARSVLPNSLKTEIVVTMDLREWRHFLRLRTSEASHPQMREVANMLLEAFREKVPVIFDEI